MDINTEQKKISANETIKLMVWALNNDRIPEAYNFADNYAKTLSFNGEPFRLLQSVLRQKPVRLTMLNALSNDLKKLLIVEDEKEQHVFIDRSTMEIIGSLKKEWENIDLFRQHNLPVRNKVLLHGPTGNGKTTIARYIAKEAGLPFIQIDSDMVIDSKLGSTMQNINIVLNKIKEPSVMFWDEIDSVGRARGKSEGSAALENERMVNSILVNMERLDNTVILIAATNRLEVLDNAFLRRFNLVHEITAPDADHKLKYAKDLCRYYNIELPEEFNRNGYTNLSQIRQDVESAAREHVLSLIA